MQWHNIYRGMVMGVTELIPGVSSSTIAMLMGFYEALIHSINQLTTTNWKTALAFLLPLGAGMMLALLAASSFLHHFIEFYPKQTFSLFTGLIIGMLPSLWKNAVKASGEAFRLPQYTLMVLVFAGVASLGLLANDASVMQHLTVEDYVYLFFSGWIASTALVLPGISGSMVFLILGTYGTAVQALSTFQLSILLTVGMGVLMGVFVTSKAIRYLLKNVPSYMYSAMVGLVAGSIIVIVPSFSASIPVVVNNLVFLIWGLVVASLLSNKNKKNTVN